MVKRLLILIGIIITFLTAVDGIFGGFERITSTYEFVSEHNPWANEQIAESTGAIIEQTDSFESDYKKISMLKPGLSLAFVESLFGQTPQISHNLPATVSVWSDGKINSEPSKVDAYIERIYIYPDYLIQIITKDGSVAAYSVTSRSLAFKPEVPYLKELRLQEMSFSDLKEYKSVVGMQMSTKHFNYIEAYYFGYPGFYNEYLFFISSCGNTCGEGSNGEELSSFYNNFRANNLLENPNFQNVRLRAHPNSFSVIGQRNDDLLSYFINEQAGPNYYDVDEFLCQK